MLLFFLRVCFLAAVRWCAGTFISDSDTGAGMDDVVDTGASGIAVAFAAGFMSFVAFALVACLLGVTVALVVPPPAYE